MQAFKAAGKAFDWLTCAQRRAHTRPLVKPFDASSDSESRIATIAYEFFVYGIALVLLAAAAVKTREVLELWRLRLPMDRWQRLEVAAMVSESTVALWFMSGFYRPGARWVTMGLLTVFLVTATTRLALGAEDCGCFGQIKVHPLASALFDASALVVLSTWRCTPIKRETPATRAIRLSAGGGILASAALVLALTNSHPSSEALVMLDAGNLVGRPFPLLPHLSTADRLRLVRGKYDVVLFDPTCVHCRAYLDTLKNQANLGLTPSIAINISHQAAGSPPSYSCPLTEIRLADEAQVVTEVPIVISLIDGTVEGFRSPKRLTK